MMLQEEVSTYRADKIAQQVDGLPVKTVEEIEQWLKKTSEPLEESVLNSRNNLKSSTKRYGTKYPVEVFYDSDSLNSDNDLVLNAFNVNYDTAFSELQNQKIISVFEKYNDIIPELEILDSLIPHTDNINSEGESSSSTQTSGISSLEITENIINGNVDHAQVQNQINVNNEQLNCNATTVNIQNQDSHSCVATNSEESTNEQLYSNSDDSNSCTNFEFNNVNNCTATETLTDQLFSQEAPKRFNLRRNTNSIFSSSINERSKLRINFIKRKRTLPDGNDTYTKDNNEVAQTKTIVDKKKKCTKSDPTVINSKNKKTLKTRSLRSSTRKRKISCSDSESSEELLKKRSYNTDIKNIVTEALAQINITDDTFQFIKTKDNVKIWQCHISNCQELFAKLCYLKYHLLQHFDVRPLKCDINDCSCAFYTGTKLKRHQDIVHKNKKDYVCSDAGCKRRFSTWSNLMQHEKVHKRPFKKCLVPDCNAEYPTQRALDVHMRSEHDSNFAPYVCSHEGCDRRFFGASSFMSHMRVHRHAKKDIECSWPDCGKKFEQPSRLKVHMNSHTGNRPYACTYEGCESTFTTAGKLARHRRRHTNDRRYVCDVSSCGKSFMRSEHLKEHKLTHNGEKLEFKCYFCTATFPIKSSLCLHVKKHLNDELGEKAKRQTKKDKTANKEEALCGRVQPIKIAIKKSKNKSVVGKSSDTENSVQIKKKVASKTSKSSNFTLDNKSSKSGTRLQKENIPPLTEIQNSNLASSYKSSLLSEEELAAYDSSKRFVCNSDDEMSASFSDNVDNVMVDLIAQSNVTQAKEAQENSQVLLNTEPSLHDRVIFQNQGSARTAFTRDNVLSLKPKRVTSSTVKTTNVVLDVANVEGDLFTEDLPSLYYQENIEVPEYQLTLLDPERPDNDNSIQNFT